VITKSGIANDLAVDGKNCLVVPHRDSKAIGRAIDRLLGSAALRSTLSAAAIASVQTFEIEPMAEAYVELLRRLDGAHQTR
jgi:glycosyltransferase involved in cell wall biosynthesis